MIQFITTKTDEELQEAIYQAVLKALGESKQIPKEDTKLTSKEYVKGISGLAALLKCSNPTAQKLKNSGKIPFYQDGRTLLFRTDEVLKSIQAIPSKRV